METTKIHAVKKEAELSQQYQWARAAIEAGEETKACSLIEELDASELDRAGRDGATLLACAIRCQRDLSFAMLLEMGASANAKTVDGQLPLMIALRAKREDYAQALLDSGADQKAKENKESDSAARLAARFVLTGALKALLEAGADLEERDEHGRRLYDYALKFSGKEVADLIAGYYPSTDARSRAAKRLADAKAKLAACA